MTRHRIAPLALLLALLALPGCGGDDEQAEALPDPPELTIPRTSPEPARTESTETTETAPDDPATAPLAPGEGDGSTPAPESQTTPDGPENDTPPPAGSPAERFEQQCDENPAACG